eukprot:jgi/Picre1/28085/NNA_001044.t1
MLDMARNLWATGGVRSLYAGLWPSMVGAGTAWGAYFYLYSLRERVDKSDLGGENKAATPGQGVLLSEGWCLTPLQRHVGLYKRIIRDEGVAGLYKGLLPSIFLVSHGAIQLTVYEKLKHIGPPAGESTPKQAMIITEAGMRGAFSKAAATIVTYPSQVMRARLQQRMDTRDLKYTSLVNTFLLTTQREGIKGLYKGLVPNLLRVMPQSGVTFAVYEAVLQALDHY